MGILDEKLGVSDVWIIDLASGNRERMTFRVLDEKSPVWFDNATLFYRSDGGGGPPDVFRLQRGDQAGTLFHRGPGVEEPHDVSSDGKWLLYVDLFATETDIHLLSLEEKPAARPLIATPFNETSPRFSPDGRWIAYASDVSGISEIYVRSFGDASRTVKVSKDGGMRPRWSSDGSQLFFIAPGGRVMAAAVREGIAESPRMLFQSLDLLDIEPSRDGRRFIAQLQERSRDTDVHLLINWPALSAEAVSR